MSVPQYIDLRKQRHQQQMKSLQIGKQVNSTISRKLHNFDNGIEEDLDESRDDRSNYERNEDLNTIRQQIGAKLNTLFANDHDEVNTFMEYINQSQISIQDFNAVYPNLLKDSDPNTNTASYSIPKFQQLLDNDNATGSTNQSSLMKDIYNLIKNIYDNGGINEKKADDLVDRAEASIQSNASNIWLNELKQKMNQSNKTEENKLIELDNMMSPLKQKLNEEINLQKVSMDEWNTATSKAVLNQSFTKDKIKKLLDDNGIKTYKSNSPKQELLNLLWDLKQNI